MPGSHDHLDPLDPLDPLGALADHRVSYEAGALDEADLPPTPLDAVRRWWSQALDAERDGVLVEPNAVQLATAGADGAPSVRTVLLKGLDARGFVVYSNLASRKSREMAEGGRAALVLAWVPLQRQVVVRGPVEQVPREESAAYFASRPRGSQLGAWASQQSAPAASREEVEAAYAEVERRFPGEVPLPDHWGGWLLRPVDVELWQGRPSRLHDRLAYVAADGAPRSLDGPAGWRVERRWP